MKASDQSKMRQLITVALVLLLAVGTSHAEINIVDSLEWMAADAPLIVRGKVTAHNNVKGVGNLIYHEATIAIEGSPKGNVEGKTLSIRLHTVGEKNPAAEWAKSGHSYLFFLRKGRPNDGRERVGWWVPRERRHSVIDLARPRNVYKADMTFAADAKEILSVVRKYAGWKRRGPEVGEPNIFKPQADYVRLEIPGSAPIYCSVYWGSACYVNVPAEEKYRTLAMAKARSKRAYERRQGADMLRNFPGPETVKILTKLLDDPAEFENAKGLDQLVRFVYSVRPTAYHALLHLGEKPKKPPFERQPTQKEITAYRDNYWKRAAREMLGKGWAVSIGEVQAPSLWTRAKGGGGLEIRCVNRKLKNAKDAQAAVLTLYVLPEDWEGQSSLGDGEKLAGGVYTLPPESTRSDRSAARYLGHGHRRHYFCLPKGIAKPAETATRIQRHFGLKITNAYILSTGIRSIGHCVPYGAARTFSANGWVDAYHQSGDPKRPRIYREHVPVPQRELVAIWRAAMALDKQILSRKEDPNARHYHQLEIFLTEGRRVVIGWPRGQGPKDPKLKRLLELVDKRRYGAW